MRIISGRFKGHRLVSFQAGHIRPTTDRVKESIFNKVMHDVVDATVWDLFSGTGNLGLEALSRGATHVNFVDKNRKSIQILMQNIQKLNVESEVQVHNLDVFHFLKKQTELPNLIFVDPPFTQSLAHNSMEAIANLTNAQTVTKVVIESSGQERIDEQYSHLNLLDQKIFGDKTLSIFSTES